MHSLRASLAANAMQPEGRWGMRAMERPPRTPKSSPSSSLTVLCSAKFPSPVLDRDSCPSRLRPSAELRTPLVQLPDPSIILPSISDCGAYSNWFAADLAAAVRSSPASEQKQESSERDNFYANMGSALRTLRQELPSVFHKDLNYEIYRDDITFRDPRNIFNGIDNYKLIFWALRFHGRIFFRAIWVDVVRIWQPSNRLIMVRWTVRGIPRVPWEAQGLFDGTSEYKLDKEGKIYEHKVDNVALNYPPIFRSPTVLDLLSSTGVATPTPTFFDRAFLASWMEFPDLKISTWERFYWALTETLDVQNSKERRNWNVALQTTSCS